uniref:Uncharacterized protein n=1 Tax=Setaria viridis TaxID=4556 RepID=A0A4V6D989_SETVI|nr:hypothetical protein SEVIR_3G088750v2 [Setaria viridis]
MSNQKVGCDHSNGGCLLLFRTTMNVQISMGSGHYIYTSASTDMLRGNECPLKYTDILVLIFLTPNCGGLWRLQCPLKCL